MTELFLQQIIQHCFAIALVAFALGGGFGFVLAVLLKAGRD